MLKLFHRKQEQEQTSEYPPPGKGYSPPCRASIQTGSYVGVTSGQRFEVPFPHLQLVTDNRWSSALPVMYMSGDMKNWIPAEFPHIERGDLHTCMNNGRISIDNDNILLCITNYDINYIQIPLVRFWEPLITVEYFDMLQFMKQWSELSVEDVLEFLKSK